MYTTLNKIRAHGPCMHGWETLLRSLGKTRPDDEPVSVVTVLKSNGIDDAIWCLRAVDGFDREKRLFAVKCARRVRRLLDDQRSFNALDVSEAYANGLASDEELGKAREAAREAAWEAARSAWDAARSAWDAAREAAWEAAWEAARSAWDAAREAAREAAWEAAWEAAAQAAREAARDAAQAARDAARSAREAARWGQGAAAGDAAYAAEREFQASLFVEMFSPIQEEK